MSKNWTQEKAFEVLEGEITRLTAENERLNSDLTDALTDRTHDQTQIMENAEQIRLLTARVAELEAVLDRIANGPRDIDKSDWELFAEVCNEARAALTQPAEPAPIYDESGSIIGQKGE